jgi:hypothetical protein
MCWTPGEIQGQCVVTGLHAEGGLGLLCCKPVGSVVQGLSAVLAAL